VSAFHKTTVTVLNHVLDEQRHDLKVLQHRLERGDVTTLKTAAERERFPETQASLQRQIAELTAVAADLVELLRLIEQANTDTAEQDRQIADDDRPIPFVLANLAEVSL
jgi:hypothetical protein